MSKRYRRAMERTLDRLYLRLRFALTSPPTDDPNTAAWYAEMSHPIDTPHGRMAITVLHVSEPRTAEVVGQPLGEWVERARAA